MVQLRRRHRAQRSELEAHELVRTAAAGTRPREAHERAVVRLTALLIDNALPARAWGDAACQVRQLGAVELAEQVGGV